MFFSYCSSLVHIWFPFTFSWEFWSTQSHWFMCDHGVSELEPPVWSESFRCVWRASGWELWFRQNWKCRCSRQNLELPRANWGTLPQFWSTNSWISKSSFAPSLQRESLLKMHRCVQNLTLDINSTRNTKGKRLSIPGDSLHFIDFFHLFLSSERVCLLAGVW